MLAVWILQWLGHRLQQISTGKIEVLEEVRAEWKIEVLEEVRAEGKIEVLEEVRAEGTSFASIRRHQPAIPRLCGRWRP